MAIAFDAASSGALTTGALSWTHTPVGTPRGILVFVVIFNDTNTVSAVTYGGVSMTEVTGSPNVHNVGGADDGTVTAWFLGSSVPTGPQTVAATVSGTPNKCGAAFSVTAGSNTSIVDTDASINSGSQANPSGTLSLGGITCFCAEGFHSGQSAVSGVTPLSGWTSRSEITTTAETAGFYTYDTIGSSDVTIGWTQTADDATCVAVAIREDAGVEYDDTISLGADLDIAALESRDLPNAMALALAAGMTMTGTIDISTASVLDLSLAIANAAGMNFEETAELQLVLAKAAAGALGVSGSISLDEALAMSAATLLDAVGAPSLPTALGLSFAGAMEMAAAAQLDAAFGVTALDELIPAGGGGPTDQRPRRHRIAAHLTGIQQDEVS